ncbi:MAG: SDR family oxidoreductase [Mycetocola sp.]
MTGKDETRHALVFGASGLVGRHLVAQLLSAGVRVTVAVRTEDSGHKVQDWLTRRAEQRGLQFMSVDSVRVDFDASVLLTEWEGAANGFGQIAGDVRRKGVHQGLRHTVTEVYNCAGSYRFGMTAEEARHANVGTVERVLDCAAEFPGVRRVVHVSGYRVGGQDPTAVPWSDARRARLYKKLGAYEGSKVESDAVFQAGAAKRGLPWTVANPSSVIGDSQTGESDQLIGLATTLRQIWDGSATALPGSDATFLPVVTADYLAAFMVAAAGDPSAVNRSYWVLDDATPPLPRLLAHLGHHLGVAVPQLRVPAAVVKWLPSWLSGAEPETLSFLSADRYPTESATELARRNGLTMPDVVASLERWADYLAAHRFSAASTYVQKESICGRGMPIRSQAPRAERFSRSLQ